MVRIECPAAPCYPTGAPVVVEVGTWFVPYNDEKDYRSDTVMVDYSTVGWYQPAGETHGRPFFAAKGTIPQHMMAHDMIPRAYNDKRYYSRAITRALLRNGALSLDHWPAYLATPAETDAFWPYRITVHNYSRFE